jgi:hypothetical protein
MVPEHKSDIAEPFHATELFVEVPLRQRRQAVPLSKPQSRFMG